MSIDLLESPFQGLRSYGILDTTINIKKMAKFYKSLQEIFDSKTHSVYIALQLQVAELINVLLSKYQHCIYQPTLKGISKNSKVTTMEVTDFEGNHHSLFLKFQIHDIQDDLRIDAYNAFVLQTLMPNSPHFIKTLDILRTFYSKKMDERVWDLEDYFGKNGSIIIQDERIEIEPPQFLPHVTEDPIILRNFGDILEDKNLRIAKLLIAKRMIGPSLSDVTYSLDSNNFNYYLPRLKKLFNVMCEVGKYGFVHNDAHIHNILFDLQTQEFALIDYGRVSVNPTLMGAKAVSVNRYIEWVTLHTEPAYLNKYLQAYQHSKQTFEYNFYYSNTVSDNFISYKNVNEMTSDPTLQKRLTSSLYLFDVSTITLGIMDLVYIKRPIETTEDMNILVKETLLDTRILIITQDIIMVREFNDLSTLMDTTSFLLQSQQNNIDTFLPGIIWTSFIFTSLYEMNPTNEIIEKREGKTTILLINRHLLKKHHLMHYYYQYSPLLLWYCRTTIFKYLDKALEYISRILGTENLNGGMLSARIPMSVRSMRSQYLTKPRRTKQPKPMDGQMDSVINYNRTEAPSEELTKWLKNYKPKPVPKVKSDEDPFTVLAPYLEATRIQNEKYHPFVEELKKYKPEIPPKYKNKLPLSSKDGSTSR